MCSCDLKRTEVNMYCIVQGRRNVDWAGGTVKKLRTMEIYEKQKILTNYACYRSTTMLTSKIINETIENLFQFDRDKP